MTFFSLSFFCSFLVSIGPITFKDGLAGASTTDDRWVVTSPNVDFVPQPALGVRTVGFCEDQRFGHEDPIQWPQIFATEYRHLTVVLRRPEDPNDPRSIMWWDLGEEDFIRDPSIPVRFLGTVSHRRVQQLRIFVKEIERRVKALPPGSQAKGYRIFFTFTALRNAFERLSYPATLRDLTRQVVQVQRFYLESLAWFTWFIDMKSYFDNPLAEPIPCNRNYMGCFSSSPSEVQRLFHAGIPVWFLRRPVEISSTTVIRLIPFHITLPSFKTIPTVVLYQGRIGRDMLAATCMGGHNYSDIESLPWNDITKNPIPAGMKLGSSASIRIPSIPQASGSSKPEPVQRTKSQGGRADPCKCFGYLD